MALAADRATGFAPVARRDARVLVLGSLPGLRSIAVHEYYAHPQNAFWPIMGELLGARGSYEERCAALLKSGIALWDVLASSVRPGSLDASIETESAEINDFARFFSRHGDIELICFNGQKAAQMFARAVLPGLAGSGFRTQTLPSTSPAYAAMTYDRKLLQWRNALGHYDWRSQ